METNYIQADLFDLIDAPTELNVREGLHSFMPLLEAALMEPWDELQAYRANDPNFSNLIEEEVAQWMTMQAAHRARQLFANEDTVQLLTIHRKLVLLVHDQFAITIKK